MGDAPSPEAPSVKEEGRVDSAPADSIDHAAPAQDQPEVGISSSAPKEDNSTTLPPEGKASADSDLKGGEKQEPTDDAVTAAEAQVEASPGSPEKGDKEKPSPAITAEAVSDAKADESATEESKAVKPADESTRMEEEGAALRKEAGVHQESTAEEESVPSKEEEKPAAKEVVNDSEQPPPPAEEAGKAPGKPKVEIFTLPIGGGPKKNIVLPPIKPMTPKPKPAELAAASSSHTRKDSTDSKVSSRQHQVGKKGSGIPVINSIRRKPAPSSSNASQGTTKSERASLRRQKATNEGEGLKRNVSMGQERGKAASAQGSAKPRRTLSASNLNDRRKTDGKTLAARPSTSEGQTRRAQRKARAAEDAKAGIDEERAGGSPQHKRNISTSSSKRRNTTSSIVMVEGQMFELNEGEEKAEGGEAEALAKKEPAYDEISEMSGLEGDADDDEEVEDEPMIYTDDELNDVPPPGAYAIHPPSTARLEKASELTLYDELGTVVSFGSIFAARRTLICFLRHWLCPFCQMFSQSLQAIDPLPLERANLDLVVIGQGHWHVTKSYKEVMKIPKFIKMYADPSRKIYKMLGMTLRTNDQGPACSRPDYQTMGVFKASMVAIKKGVIDMPLRPPGDLKLLGGEFILGPGPQCSFTHRMVTTRGHLDLPRILVQAGCDLSLKSAPAVLDEQNSLRRPGSTKSTDRRSTRRLAKKLAKRRKGSAEFGKRDAEWNRRNQYNTLRALNGELESQQARTLPRSFSKRKPPPLPDVRHLNIGYPMKTLPSGFGSEEENDGQKVAAVAQPARRRFVSASVSDTEETDDDEGPSSPTLSSTKPLFIVKDRLTNGMVNGFSSSSSMTSLDRSFIRPPRSTDRPPLPQTSSAAAYAAATARAKLLLARQESEMEVLSGSTSRIQARPYDGALIAGSMPSLSRNSHGSNGSLRTLPGALGSYQGRENAGTSATADSAQTMVSSPSESGMSFSSIGIDNSVSSHSLFSSQGDFRGNDSTLTHSDLQATGATNPLTRSGSIKRNSKPAAVGVPKSVLERMASTGSPRRTAFSTSSPSLPLGDATFSDVMGGVKTPTTPSMDHGKDDFGEDTDYKRLDRKALETPPASVYTSPLLGAARNGRDFPSEVSEKDVNEVTRSPKPFANLDKPLPTLSASMKNDAQQSSNGTTKTTDLEDGDLLKTPLARKISLDAGDFGSERASQSTDRSSGALQEIASSSPPSKNRGSIIAAVPTPVSPPSQATALPAFNSNPLLAALFPESPAPVPQVAAPAPAPVLSAAPAAAPARVPASAQNPLFAAILAEEEARKARPSNGNKVERPSTSVSTQVRQPLAKVQAVERPKTSPISPVKRKATGMTFGGGSFLDDLDVHDSLRDNSNRNSTSSTQNGATDHADSDENGEETEEEEDDDDWAPLRASSNMIPAGMPHDDSEQSEGESQRGDASDQSPGEEEGDDDDDDEEAAVQRIVRATPASQYSLKQVTGRPLSQPTATRPRTVKLKTAGANRVSKPQGLALLSFTEEDEETAGQA